MQPLKLVQEVETRWNSLYDRLQRLLDLREPVGAALASVTTDIMPLSSADYDVISECLEVLAPFQYATTELSEEKRVSASKIIPIVRMIKHVVAEKTALARHDVASSLGTALQQQIIKRCSTVETIRVLALATLLDPRFKALGFSNEDHAQEAERQLTEECAAVLQLSSDQAEEPSTSQVAPNALTSNRWELLDSRVSETHRNVSFTADATTEVKMYLNDTYLPRNGDPLQYWEAHKVMFPNLYVLATKYLSVTATSVPCERIFSKAGDVINIKRSRLSPYLAEQIIFLNKNRSI